MAATLQKSTIVELKKLAKKEKVSLTGLKVKSDIVRAIIDHRAKASKAKSMTTGKAAPKKAPVKKAPVKKAPVKKAPVKKAPVKKAPVKAAPKKAAVTEPKKKAPVKVETLVGKMKIATVRDRLAKAGLPSKDKKEEVIRDRLIAHLKQERRSKAAKKAAATKKAAAKAAPKKAPAKAAPKKAATKAPAKAEPKKKAPVKVETLVGKMKIATVRDRLDKAGLAWKSKKEEVIRANLISHLKQERRSKAAKKAAATKKAAAKAAPKATAKAVPKPRAKAKRCTDVEDPIVCKDNEVCLTKTGKCAKDTKAVRAGKNMYVLTLGSDRKIVGIKATLERLKKIFEAAGQEDITLEPATAKEKKAVAEVAKKEPVVIESEGEESEGEEETEELEAKVSEEETEVEESESEGEGEAETESSEQTEGEEELEKIIRGAEEEESEEEPLEFEAVSEAPVKSKTPKAASPKKTPVKKASPKAAAREVPEQKIMETFKECLSRM